MPALAIIFFIYSAAVALVIRNGIATQSKKVANTYIFWLVVVGALAANGFLVSDETQFPKIVFVALPTAIFVWALALSSLGRRLALYFSQSTLIGLQAFRVGVECLLVYMYVAGLIPRMMTWHGQNYDLLVGISAPILVYVLARIKDPKAKWRLIFYWNLVSMGVLANVMIRGILSTPSPIRYFKEDVPNIAVMEFPYVYLVVVFVAVAMGLHLLSLRKLFTDARHAQDVQLEKPGAGIPNFTRYFFRVKLLPEISSRWEPQQAISHYLRESKKIIAMTHMVPVDARNERVLVDPIRGLEDSSRFWSVNLVLEHLAIVGGGMLQIIEKLARNEEPGIELDIAKVKPPGTQILSPEAAENLFADIAKRALEIDSKNQSFMRFSHPWFGKMSVHEWTCLLALHQSIHKRQMELIAEGLRIPL